MLTTGVRITVVCEFWELEAEGQHFYPRPFRRQTMGSYLYCDLLKQDSNEKIKTFSHLSWYTKDFFQDPTDYRVYNLDFPVLEMGVETKPLKGLNDVEQQIPCISFNYHDFKALLDALHTVKYSIQQAHNKRPSDVTLIEEYTNVKNVIEELTYCFLYCKYELGGENTVFKFYIL